MAISESIKLKPKRNKYKVNRTQMPLQTLLAIPESVSRDVQLRLRLEVALPRCSKYKQGKEIIAWNYTTLSSVSEHLSTPDAVQAMRFVQLLKRTLQAIDGKLLGPELDPPAEDPHRI